MSRRAVCILTNTRDLAADEIVRRLDDRNRQVIRLNADRLTDLPTWSLTDAFDIDVGAIWWRQFEIASDGVELLSAVDDLLVTRAQWRAWLSGFDTGHTAWINGLWEARKAENKIEQLRLAQSIGFRVPETIVTNCLDDAASFHGHGPAVIKSLSSGYFEFSGQGFVYTHHLDEGILTRPGDLWAEQPMIIQRYTPGLDVRVVAFDRQCFGAACRAQNVDWRLDGSATSWDEYSVSEQTRQLCFAYLDRMQLRYAAFDLIDDGNAVWFLEANQAGEWVFLERALRLGIADALAGYLDRLASDSNLP